MPVALAQTGLHLFSPLRELKLFTWLASGEGRSMHKGAGLAGGQEGGFQATSA